MAFMTLAGYFMDPIGNLVKSAAFNTGGKHFHEETV